MFADRMPNAGSPVHGSFHGNPVSRHPVQYRATLSLSVGGIVDCFQGRATITRRYPLSGLLAGH